MINFYVIKKGIARNLSFKINILSIEKIYLIITL